MSITDELREYVQDWRDTPSLMDGLDRGDVDGILEDFVRIADRIDERVKNIRFNEHHKGYQDGIMDGCSHYDPERTECMVSEEHAYIKLPVDADGEYIHIGDELDVGFVARIVITDDEWPPYLYAYKETPRILTQHFCDEVSHHHAPTVEDVLREFAQEMNENLGMYTGEAIDADEWRDADAKTVEKYAAKLRLREDA